MRQHYDLIFVGAGLANGLIALRLQQQLPNLRIVLIETDSTPGGNHTWSFHAEDLNVDQHRWIASLVVHKWSEYQVRFPKYSRRISSDYFTVSSQRFSEVLRGHFGQHMLLDVTATLISNQSVKLSNGRMLSAGAVIDGRGYQSDDTLRVGFQAFIGQEWQLSQQHGLIAPVIMDATVDQQYGYRFVYTLPLSASSLLIEDTHYLDEASLNIERARRNIRDYAQRQRWLLKTLLREEQGILPITLTGDIKAFWKQRPIPCSGLRAGLFHPTTGYSLPLAVALADKMITLNSFTPASLHEVVTRFAKERWRKNTFFRMLNRILFLAAPANERWRIIQSFYRLPEGLISRFYAGQLTLPDRLRILSGKPSVPVLTAVHAILQSHRLRVKK